MSPLEQGDHGAQPRWPTRQEVVTAAGPDCSYERAAASLGVPAGLAYLIATGRPADDSDGPSPEELARPGLLTTSSQHLANPPVHAPTCDPVVLPWLRARAARDEAMQSAAAEHSLLPPPIEAERETDDLASVLGWDHGQIRYLQKELAATPAQRSGGTNLDHARRVEIARLLVQRLRGHEAAEEADFWPFASDRLGEARPETRTARSQEREIGGLLDDLLGAVERPEAFDELVEKLESAVRVHLALEDWALLELRRSVPDAERREAGRVFKASRNQPLGSNAKEGR